MIAKTQTEINVDDDGKVTVSGLDRAKVDEAVAHIGNITREIQVGEEFEGEVKRILPFGAMVEILPGKEGLVSSSQLASYRVNRVEDVVKIGQELKVRVIEIDDQGRVNLSARFDEGASQPFSGQIGNGPRRDFAPRRFDRRHQRGPDRRRPPKRY